MIKGIYNSASAMIPRLRQQEVIANNIANVTTPGFKKDAVFVSELSRAQQRATSTKSDWETPMIDQVYTDYSQGSLNKTGSYLDLAIEGPGFFVAQSAEGDELLVRNGSFKMDDLGFLVTDNGDRIAGEGGPLQLSGGDVTVGSDGTISVNENVVGSIRVATVEDPTRLVKTDGGKYMVPDGVELQAAVNYVVRQGYLESSNVDVITQMVEMISSYRSYEADSQALKSQDESLQRLISEVGRTE